MLVHDVPLQGPLSLYVVDDPVRFCDHSRHGLHQASLVQRVVQQFFQVLGHWRIFRQAHPGVYPLLKLFRIHQCDERFLYHTSCNTIFIRHALHTVEESKVFIALFVEDRGAALGRRAGLLPALLLLLLLLLLPTGQDYLCLFRHRFVYLQNGSISFVNFQRRLAGEEGLFPFFQFFEGHNFAIVSFYITRQWRS